MNQAAPLIVGDPQDLHVQAVCNLLRHCQPSIFDVATLGGETFVLEEALFFRAGVNFKLGSERPQSRGWIRRLAPLDWNRGIALQSRESAVSSSWMSLLAGVVRSADVEWLTTLDSVLVAESKLTQIQAARALGIQTPRTIVTNNLAAALEAIDGATVVKPLGPSHYFDEFGDPRMVYTTEIELAKLPPETLAGAPFLIQKLIPADFHLRVVTVLQSTWVASIEASGRPLDWRREDAAHGEFLSVAEPDPAIVMQAQAIARRLMLGYSSQDWIVNSEGAFLLDVNPSGQWLFLPEPIATEVAECIAIWLGGIA
ncbi:MAG: hypothetical protein Q8M73_06215 [Actinomycetota bacterium]|nr:hypothetical protein [Actinomycetota bacterium]